MLVTYPDPRLTQVAAKATVPAPDLADIFSMLESLRVKYGGIGIAAPQAGLSLRLCICVIGNQRIYMCNPQITAKFGRAVEQEGCLSIPDKEGDVPRATLVTCVWSDPSGRKLKRDFRGYAARIVQHEVDHLNGLLWVDRVQATNA